MNRSNNERFQATETKIINTFISLLEENSLSDITVSELCRKCSIHRTSFYLHFQDIYNLMDAVERRLAGYYASLFESPAEQYNLGIRFQRLFAFILEHRAFYRVYWQQARDLRVLDAALSEDTEDKLKRTAAGYGFQTEKELQFHRVFFKAGLAALIGYWLSRDCPETPKELGEILRKEYWDRNYLTSE